MARLLLFVVSQGERWDMLTKAYLTELRQLEAPKRAGIFFGNDSVM